MHGDEARAGILVQVLGAGDEFKAHWIFVNDAGHGLQPEGAFKPPVAKEFGIKGRAEHGRNGVLEALLQGLPDQMDKVGGVGLGAFGGFRGVVGLLVAHIDAGAGDAPVAVSAGPALLVEVEVSTVAGVAGVARPDLHAGLGVPREDGGGETLVVGAIHVIRLVEAAIVVVGHRLFGVAGHVAAQQLVGRGDTCGLLNEVRVDEEEFDVGFAERLLDADAVKAGGGGGAVRVANGIVPEAGGAVAALRRPDAFGVLADVAYVGGDGGANLGADALVCAQQRHVAVRGAAGDDLNQTLVVEVAESLNNIAAERVEVAQGVREELVPEAGGLGEVGLARGGEVGIVLAGGDDLALHVAWELSLEDRMGKLLQQDGRDVQVAVQANAVGFQAAKDT